MRPGKRVESAQRGPQRCLLSTSMSHPHVIQEDRDALDDLGLIDNDHTEVLGGQP